MENLNIPLLGKEKVNQNGLYAEKKAVHSYHAHTHIFYEIILYEPFKGHITVNGTNYSIEQPTILFMTPTDIHSTYVDGPSPAAFYKLCFETTEHIATTTLNPILQKVEDKFEFFKQLFENALANQHNFLYLQTTIQLIILELESNLKSNPKKSDKKSSLVFYAMQLVNQHFTERISLESIAQQLFVTPQYLSSQFTKIAKITFSDYLNDKRLSYAANLLLKKYSVSEACFACGYNNLSHFIRQFKKKFNMSPSKFN